MSALLISAMLVVSVPSEGEKPVAAFASPAVAPEKRIATPRTGAQLRDAVREAVRRWGRPADEDAKLAAEELLKLYGELQADDKLARSQRERLCRLLRTRLLALSRQISRHAAIEKRLAKEERPRNVDPPRAGILAQRGGFIQPRLGAAPMGAGVGIGGPGRQTADYGDQLVELIQRTVAPSTWDVNGGPGTIYYWQPGRAIVVRQMGQVHDEIADVLRQLGRMGR